MTLFGYRLFDYSGRMNRKPYIMGVLTFFVIFGAIQAILAALSAVPVIGSLAMILFMALPALSTVISVCWSVRRLHDLNRSGWYLLLGFIPVINFVLVICLVFMKGTAGYNDYGPDPLS